MWQVSDVPIMDLDLPPLEILLSNTYHLTPVKSHTALRISQFCTLVVTGSIMSQIVYNSQEYVETQCAAGVLPGARPFVSDYAFAAGKKYVELIAVADLTGCLTLISSLEGDRVFSIDTKMLVKQVFFEFDQSKSGEVKAFRLSGFQKSDCRLSRAAKLIVFGQTMADNRTESRLVDCVSVIQFDLELVLERVRLNHMRSAVSQQKMFSSKSQKSVVKTVEIADVVDSSDIEAKVGQQKFEAIDAENEVMAGQYQPNVLNSKNTELGVYEDQHILKKNEELQKILESEYTQYVERLKPKQQPQQFSDEFIHQMRQKVKNDAEILAAQFYDQNLMQQLKEVTELKRSYGKKPAEMRLPEKIMKVEPTPELLQQFYSEPFLLQLQQTMHRKFNMQKQDIEKHEIDNNDQISNLLPQFLDKKLMKSLQQQQRNAKQMQTKSITTLEIQQQLDKLSVLFYNVPLLDELQLSQIAHKKNMAELKSNIDQLTMQIQKIRPTSTAQKLQKQVAAIKSIKSLETPDWIKLLQPQFLDDALLQKLKKHMAKQQSLPQEELDKFTASSLAKKLDIERQAKQSLVHTKASLIGLKQKQLAQQIHNVDGYEIKTSQIHPSSTHVVLEIGEFRTLCTGFPAFVLVSQSMICVAIENVLNIYSAAGELQHHLSFDDEITLVVAKNKRCQTNQQTMSGELSAVVTKQSVFVLNSEGVFQNCAPMSLQNQLEFSCVQTDSDFFLRHKGTVYVIKNGQLRELCQLDLLESLFSEQQLKQYLMFSQLPPLIIQQQSEREFAAQVPVFDNLKQLQLITGLHQLTITAAAEKQWLGNKQFADYIQLEIDSQYQMMGEQEKKMMRAFWV